MSSGRQYRSGSSGMLDGLTSCMAALLEEEGGYPAARAQQSEASKVEEDAQIRAVFEEGLRLKRKAKDLTRVLQETEERRKQDYETYDRYVQEMEARMENAATAHALDIQAIRDSQAIEFHDLLSQLLECKNALARKSSDVEELSTMLRAAELESKRREDYFQKCVKDLIDAHEVDKQQLQSLIHQQQRKSSCASAPGAEAASSPEDAALLHAEVKSLQESLLKERADKNAASAALVASRLAQEDADRLNRQLTQDLHLARAREMALCDDKAQLLASKNAVEKAVLAVKDENERLALHIRVHETAPRGGSGKKVSLGLHHASVGIRVPLYPPPPVPSSTPARSITTAGEDVWGPSSPSPVLPPQALSPLKAATPIARPGSVGSRLRDRDRDRDRDSDHRSPWEKDGVASMLSPGKVQSFFCAGVSGHAQSGGQPPKLGGRSRHTY